MIKKAVIDSNKMVMWIGLARNERSSYHTDILLVKAATEGFLFEHLKSKTLFSVTTTGNIELMISLSKEGAYLFHMNSNLLELDLFVTNLIAKELKPVYEKLLEEYEYVVGKAVQRMI